MTALSDAQSALAAQGASVIVLRRDSVLMVERGRPPWEGLWSFPGGRCEADEDCETSARRELWEETGLTVGPMVALGTFQPAPESSPLWLTVFAARGGEAEPLAGDDARQAELVPFNLVLSRPLTAGAPGWIARAMLALSNPPLV